jgi:hypothetical protein
MTELQLQQIQPPKRGKRSIDDQICDKEIEDCRIAREKASGNGSDARVASNGAQKICYCLETRMPDGTRRALHTEADCLYTAARSALVFSAATLATADGATGYDFTKLFAKEMERLAFNAGLLR